MRTQQTTETNFKNTEEAIAYGNSIKGNRAKIEDLRNAQTNARQKYYQLLDEGKEAEALYLASGQLQFTREAIQSAERV